LEDVVKLRGDGNRKDLQGESEGRYGKSFHAVATDTRTKWKFAVEDFIEEAWNVADPEAVEHTAYLTAGPADLAKVQGINPKRIPPNTPLFVFIKWYLNYRWFICRFRAVPTANIEIVPSLETSVAMFMLKDPVYSKNLPEKTVQGAYKEFCRMRAAVDVWNQFVGEATR